MTDDGAKGFAGLSLADFSDRLASMDPTPGGGTASAVSGAFAASLGGMVCALGLKRAEGEKKQTLEEHQQGFAEARKVLFQLADQDALAFELVMKAYKLPKGSDVERHARREAVSIASIDAATVPGKTADRALKTLRLFETLVPVAPKSALSDVAVGALLAAAAIRGALQNVRVNLGSIEDKAAAASLGADADRVESAASQSEFKVLQQLGDRNRG